ncbi:PREDICTED: coiled-coil domain-containing protein 185 [Gekko japonicus]|uniref:Coiled-coil domain-containing protein 185 n=1 Tax=Gekko japonicus TaxID=146911 RepID=A0ABM1JMZ4_GEKJA|nr:PREDICTED: coiled-coil domain-containing protein 185 [Gekko japonicus]
MTLAGGDCAARGAAGQATSAMRRQQQRRRPRRGSGQGLGAERGWRVSPSDRGAPSTNEGGKKAAAASCHSLSGAESQHEMRRLRSPSRFSPPPRGFTDPYSSEPEAAGGEGCLERQALSQMYRDEARTVVPRKGKSGTNSQQRSKTHRAASAHPRRLAAWPQHHPAPAGEGCATPCTTSCTTLYGGEFQAHPEPPSRSPAGRGTRVEELLRDDQWASPVPRPGEYGTDFPTDASKPPSICPSSFSFSQLDKPNLKLPKKELKRGNWQEPCESSPSITDLMHSLARPYEDEETQAYLGRDPNGQHHRHYYHHHHKSRKGDTQINHQDFTDKRYEDLIPERDKKIAALMLARHQEEEDLKDKQLQTSEAWEQMKRKERKHKARMEKERQYQLAESLEQWQRERDQRKAKLRLEEQQLLAAREKEMMLRDKKWKKMTKEQESRRRIKLDNNKLQADYKKRCQERQLWDKSLNERNAKERASHLYKEQMLQALERRLMKEMEKKRKRADMNKYKKARHMHMKEQVDDKVKAEELYKRLCIEQKLQRSQEILEQLLEERNRELKEKSFKEEEQGLIAKVRAKETEEEKRRRKEMLLQIAEMKIQQAKEIVNRNTQNRVQRAREINFVKERNHHCRKQKLDDDEKCHLREIQEAIRRKDQKSNQILRDKETAIEESRRIAKASYDLREKMRDLINRGSFDQMAFDAHRHASLLKGL